MSTSCRRGANPRHSVDCATRTRRCSSPTRGSSGWAGASTGATARRREGRGRGRGRGVANDDDYGEGNVDVLYDRGGGGAGREGSLSSMRSASNNTTTAAAASAATTTTTTTTTTTRTTFLPPLVSQPPLPPSLTQHGDYADVAYAEHLARSGMELHHRRTGRGMQHEAAIERAIVAARMRRMEEEQIVRAARGVCALNDGSSRDGGGGFPPGRRGRRGRRRRPGRGRRRTRRGG